MTRPPTTHPDLGRLIDLLGDWHGAGDGQWGGGEPFRWEGSELRRVTTS